MPIWKLSILLLSQISKGYHKGRILPSKKIAETICPDTSGQTLNPDLENWLLLFPSRFCNPEHVTAFNLHSRKEGPYLFGPQFINLKNVRKKNVQGTLSSSEIHAISYMKFFLTYRLSPSETSWRQEDSMLPDSS